MTNYTSHDFKFRDRISFKQAKYIVLIALTLGLFFSILQVYLDFKKQNSNLNLTIKQVLNLVVQPASQATYSLDKEMIIEVINGLFEYKPIFEAAILDERGNPIAIIQGKKEKGRFRFVTDSIFGKVREFNIPLLILPPPVSFSEMYKVIKVGELHVKVDTYPLASVFLERSFIEFGSGMLRNIILSLILLIFFHYFLTKPFLNLESELRKINPNHPERIRLKTPPQHKKDEFSRMVNAANDLLGTIQKNLTDRIIRVAERERLQGELVERKKRQKELEEMKDQLENTNLELLSTLDDLKVTQAKLIQSEKMAALGEVTASMSHEINTPLGLGVSGASHLHEELIQIKKNYEENNIVKSDFDEFLSVGIEITDIITINLKKAYRLVKSFKQVAVDQASEAKRIFNLIEYTQQILMSMGSVIKNSGHKISITGNKELKVDGYPGGFSQIVNNLITNSIKHAFDDGKKGNITLDFKIEKEKLIFIYSDDGKGIAPENIERIYEPYFTTNPDKGGSGLGMHVIHDIITKQYNGTIECKSEVEKGVTFTITFQQQLPTSGGEVFF